MTKEDYAEDNPGSVEYDHAFPKAVGCDLDRILPAQPRVCLNFLDIPLLVSTRDDGVE